MVYKCVVLSGCGFLACAHVGFLLTMEMHQQLEHVKQYVGVSAGSLIAFLYICGIELQEIYDYFCKMKTQAFLYPVDLSTAFLSTGLVSMRPLIGFTEILLEKHNIESSITFAELHSRSGIKLSVVVTNTEKFQAEYLNVDTTPDLEILKAVCWSCSVPFFFTNEETNYIDGVLSDPLPIQYCLKTFNEEQVCAHQITSEGMNFVKVHNIVNLVQNLAMVFFNSISPIDLNFKNLIITNITEFGPLTLNLDSKAHEHIFSRGAYYTKRFFKNFER